MIAIDEKSLLAIKDKVNKNNNKLNNVRIYFSGVGCDGPNFDITHIDLAEKLNRLFYRLSHHFSIHLE